ncbi:rod shape-determining protein MreD [Geomicrobium halophilum]|uniref:Rod shape-determining protein MreD n=1 Tax=Geomicrobium halophilum TaxID=549000 RepID=A0A841PHT7_9BACL|nr:rod shape-determining protein MreD [Geomicrobium halophilum]MBB6448350.1 rod shape-determining protein MreD [Geomicrobium halophilum]
MRYLLPLFVAVLFLFEGTWFQVLFPRTLESEFIWVPRFTLVLIVLISIYKGSSTGLIYGIIVGFFQDVVYSSLLGIYLFSYGLLGYMSGVSYEAVKNRVTLLFVVVVLVVSSLELFTYGIYQGIGYTAMPFADFAQYRWLPSLLLNGVFLMIIVFPIRKLIRRLNDEERLLSP